MSANVFSLAGVKYVITPYKINHPLFSLKKTISPPSDLRLEPFFMYDNKDARARAYFASTIRKIDTLEDFTNQINNEKFLEEQITLVEDDAIAFKNDVNNLAPLTLVSESPTEIILEGSADKTALLVLTDTNYPGWQAFIDNLPTRIYNVNLVQRGIYFPAGKHQVKFVFKSSSFELGKKITIASYFIISAVVFLSVLTFAHKSPGAGKLS